jgi:hypothetical protein
MCWQSMHHHRFRAGCWSFVPLPLHHTHLTAIVQCPRRELNLPAQNESPLKRAPAPFRVLEFSARSFMAGWASSTFLQICYQMGIRCLPVQLLPIPSAFRSSGFPILAANNGGFCLPFGDQEGKGREQNRQRRYLLGSDYQVRTVRTWPETMGVVFHG